ncbi:MAG: dual specificity protein phosphatase family protein [Thermodesulfobacteriota bacterium]|nr:dual specificity protein phosphatase family protein [Thermodesulfobacteriota bacterium]
MILKKVPSSKIKRFLQNFILPLSIFIFFLDSCTLYKLKDDSDKIPNFHKVNNLLYRGGQPTKKSFLSLKKLNISVIINLRSTCEDVKEEGEIAEAMGMKFVSIPWKLWNPFCIPKDEDVTIFLNTLKKEHEKGKKVFVHCLHGRDRAGIMIACYRISECKWSFENAYEEMKKYGFLWWWYFRFKSYLYEFSEKNK